MQVSFYNLSCCCADSQRQEGPLMQLLSCQGKCQHVQLQGIEHTGCTCAAHSPHSLWPQPRMVRLLGLSKQTPQPI